MLIQPSACAHMWIDPNDAPIERASYSPIVGPLRRQMKAGRTYVCQNCGAKLPIHQCRALGCDTVVTPLELYCVVHAPRLKEKTRAVLERTYRPGERQQNDVFMRAFVRAQREVADRVARREPERDR